MNKRSVIKTLRKDFELVLMQDVDSSNGYIRKDSILLYYIFPQEKGFNCYVTNTSGDQLVRLERSSKRKPVVQMIMQHFINGLPDTIGVTHLNFNFTIGLKQIER